MYFPSLKGRLKMYQCEYPQSCKRSRGRVPSVMGGASAVSRMASATTTPTCAGKHSWEKARAEPHPPGEKHGIHQWNKMQRSQHSEED